MLIEWGVPEDRFHHVPHGLDHGPFASLGREPRRDGPLRIGFLGTYAPHKGLDVLVRAVAGLPAGMIELLAHGPPGQPADFADRCRELAGEASVSIEGPLPRTDVPRFLAEIDLLCMPSVWNECQPLIILESFLAGTPCLVSNLGGMAELVEEGRGGGRAVAGDVEDWRGILRALVEEEGKLEAWRQSIPRVPDVEEHAGRLEAIYAELLGGE